MCCVSEEEKRAEKDKGRKSGDEPIRGVVKEILKFWLDGPMKRGEWFRILGVWGDDAEDVEGKV